ncbi:MAG: di-trans,poly-cis-decaprenylcistransferase [Gemmatimonadaceae bacterium]|nr:di-trans,poly-cis-decaprenylcistransferase [Gemmatimonadaceae bacterium]
MPSTRLGASSAMSGTFDGPHVAIIMDGNGRWATGHGLSRSAGHEAGLRTARNIVEAAVREGVGTLTLYAFSSDNWKRPGAEVTALMRLFRRALVGEAKRCLENGVRLTILGRRDRLPSSLRHTVEQVEAITSTGSRMHLRVAVDYSARDAVLRAAEAMRGDTMSRDGFSDLLARTDHDRLPARDVDLVIRTGGEQRLSDFLLWECAYAELLFVKTMWPEFTAADLAIALEDLRSRNRRFGLAPEQVAS